LGLISLWGCSSKKEEKKIVNIKKQSSKTVAKKDKVSNNIAKLYIDTNNSIEISKNDIKTDICKQNDSTIILNIFATWANTSLIQLKLLDKIQSTKNICIISIALTNDSKTLIQNRYKSLHQVFFHTQNNSFVNKLLEVMDINKKFKLPMNIVYKKHKYLNNYQGVMPLEMLKYIIKG